MNRFLIVLCMCCLPATLLTAQQNFEGKIVYNLTQFTDNKAVTDSLTIWLSGGKCKIVAPRWAGAGIQNRLAIIIDADKDLAHLPNLDGEINTIQLSMFNMVSAAKEKKTFTGDSMVVYGYTCFKYLQSAETGAGAAGWFSPAHVFTPGQLHQSFPFLMNTGTCC